MSGMNVCPRCNARMPENAKFCGSCGNQTPTQHAAPAQPSPSAAPPPAYGPPPPGESTQYGGAAPWNMPPPAPSTPSSIAGLTGLFDMGFTRFVSLPLAKIRYILAMVGIGLFYLLAGISSVYSSPIFAIFWFLLVGPFFALLALLGVRGLLERQIILFRIHESTDEMARASRSAGAGQ